MTNQRCTRPTNCVDRLTNFNPTNHPKCNRSTIWDTIRIQFNTEITLSTYIYVLVVLVMQLKLLMQIRQELEIQLSDKIRMRSCNSGTDPKSSGMS